MQDLFTNTFQLDGKKRYQWQECLKMEERNDFHQLENELPLAGIKLFFKNWISASRKKMSKFPHLILHRASNFWWSLLSISWLNVSDELYCQFLGWMFLMNFIVNFVTECFWWTLLSISWLNVAEELYCQFRGWMLLMNFIVNFVTECYWGTLLSILWLNVADELHCQFRDSMLEFLFSVIFHLTTKLVVLL